MEKKQNKEHKMKEVIEIIEDLKDKHPFNPPENNPPLNYSLFFSDVRANVEIIFKENEENSTVDGKFGVIIGNLNPNGLNNFFQYQLLGSDNAITFEASLLTSQVPINISYQNQDGLLIAFISGVGELATTTNTFSHVPFTLIIQKTNQLGNYLLTIDPLSNEAPIIMSKSAFTSPDRIFIKK